MKVPYSLLTIRVLLLTAVLMFAATPTKAGDIQIGPAPCNPSTQQCAANYTPDLQVTPSTEEDDSQTLTESVMRELSAAFVYVLLSFRK